MLVQKAAHKGTGRDRKSPAFGGGRNSHVHKAEQGTKTSCGSWVHGKVGPQVECLEGRRWGELSAMESGSVMVTTNEEEKELVLGNFW